MKKDLFERAFAVAEELERGGLPPGVQAVTVGFKRIGKETTQTPALIFMVDRKRPRDEIHPAMAIPPELHGLATDVVEMNVKLHESVVGPYDRVEPLLGGISIKADWKRGIGTLGAIFCDRTTRQPVGLTNRHVVDNWTFNANGQSIFQPSEARENLIGTVRQHNTVWDCAAIALSVEARRIDRSRSFLGRPGRIVAIGRAEQGMSVFKVGARTGDTKAEVASSGPSGVEIRPSADWAGRDISDEGDSGAVWATETAEGYVAVALHWGGSTGVAWAKPMIEVARLLDLDVLDP